MSKDGKLILEIGFNQLDTVCQILIENGYSIYNITKDINGLDRAICANIPA